MAAILCLVGRPAPAAEPPLPRLAGLGGFLEGVIAPHGSFPPPGQERPFTPRAPARAAQAAPEPGPDLGGAWKRLAEALAPAPGSFPGPALKWLEERLQIVRLGAEGVFTISAFQNGSKADPLEGGRASGVFAPALRLAEDTALVLIGNASYNRELQVFTEDEGPRQRTEEQRHEFTLLLSQDYQKPFGLSFINRLTVSPSVFQTYTFTRQTADERWGNGVPFGGLGKFKGLYDYWDRGAGLEVKLLHEEPEERRHTLTFSGQAYLRHYRNFISLARQLDPSSPEPKFEKDYGGLLGRVVYDYQLPSGSSARLVYTRLSRLFTEDRADKDPLAEPGVAGEKRRDAAHTVEARGGYAIPSAKGLVVGLGGGWSYNESTSGFNDTLSPIPATGHFSQRYYDYWSFSLAPDVSYSWAVSLPWFGRKLDGMLTLSGSYSYERRAYADRKAKDKDGGFRDTGIGNKDQLEVDVTHVISPRLLFQFHKNWILVGEAKRSIAHSNFEDERVFRYNYEINSFGLGLQYRY